MVSCIVLYYNVLYYIVLFSIVLCCTVLYWKQWHGILKENNCYIIFSVLPYIFLSTTPLYFQIIDDFEEKQKKESKIVGRKKIRCKLFNICGTINIYINIAIYIISNIDINITRFVAIALFLCFSSKSSIIQKQRGIVDKKI